MTSGADTAGWIFVVLVVLAALVPVAAFLCCIGALITGAIGSSSPG